MDGGALDGVRVLDLTQGVAGPYATKLFSDYGADVIKIERPGGGDITRRIGPFLDDAPHTDAGGLFLDLNTGKRSVTLNLGVESGQQILRRLAAKTEIVFESFRPGTLAGFGLDGATLREVNPAATLISISNFGQDGPYRDLLADDFLLYAAGGVLAKTAAPGREPLRIALYAPLFLVGGMAAAMSIGAYLGARRNEEGERVDFSIMEALATSMDRGSQHLVGLQYSGSYQMTPESIFARASALPGGAYGGVYPCREGYINIIVYAYWWDRFCRMIGRPELIDDPAYTTRLTDPEFGPEIDELFYPWLMERTNREVMLEGQAAGIPVGALNTMDSVFTDPQLRDREYIVTLDHPVAGELEYPGPPFRMSDTPGKLRRAPLLGEHTVAVLSELGYTPEEMVILRQRDVI